MKRVEYRSRFELNRGTVKGRDAARGRVLVRWDCGSWGWHDETTLRAL